MCHDCHWCVCMQANWYAGSMSHSLDYCVCVSVCLCVCVCVCVCVIIVILRRYDISRERYTAGMMSSVQWRSHCKYYGTNDSIRPLKVSSVLSWILPLALSAKQPSHLLFLVLEFFQPLFVNAFCPFVAVPEVGEVQLGWLAPNRFKLRQRA